MARKVRPRHKPRLVNWDEDGIITRTVGTGFAFAIMLTAPLVHYVVVPLGKLWRRGKGVLRLQIKNRPSSTNDASR